MANPLKGQIQVNLAGKDYTVRLSIDALMQIENALDNAELTLDDFIHESSHYVTDFEELKTGTYVLKHDLCHEETGEDIFKKGTKIRVEDFTNPVDKVLNINIFEAKHITTGQKIYISEYDIER